MKSLNLFFSYGHERPNEIVVNKIREKLMIREHKVWIDKKNIPLAEDWRRLIQMGINDSDGVVAFISKHAVRKIDGTPGVCLDELSIAISIPELVVVTVLLESEKDLDIPPTVSSIQRLDMSDWWGKYEAGEQVFDEYLEEKISLIIEALESKSVFEFQNEIEFLRKILKPDLGRKRYDQLTDKPIVGRTWLSKTFDEYVKKRESERFFCIYGGPGYGKSQLVATLMHFNPQIVAGYFFEWEDQSENSIQSFICTIAFQMATKIPDYRAALIDKLKKSGYYTSAGEEIANVICEEKLKKENPSRLFKFLISDIIMIDASREKRLIVIDGVDEAEFRGKNPLVDFLCGEAIKILPSWLKILVTTRDEEKIRLKFQALKSVEVNLDRAESNTDIKKYLNFRLYKQIQQGIITDQTIDLITERCEKSFVFAEKLCDAYVEEATFLNDITKIPRSINGLYFSYFERLFKNDSYDETRKKLAVIVANNGAISESLFCEILELDSCDLEQFLTSMRSFVKVTIKNDVRMITFYHKTVNDWLVNKEAAGEYTVNRDLGNKLIIDFCKKAIEIFVDSVVSWGFDGRKPILSFETMMFIYTKVIESNSSELKRKIHTDLKFLYALQLNAYVNSKYSFAEEIFNKIKFNYSLLSEREKREKEKFYVGSMVLNVENGIARGEERLETLIKIKEDFSECLNKEYALNTIVECNICYLLKNRNSQEAECRMRGFLEEIVNNEYPEKYTDMAVVNNILSSILYNQKKYSEAIEKAELAVSLAEQFYEEPDRIYLLAHHIMGSCYQKLCSLSKSGEERKKLVLLQKLHKEHSLEMRKARYGNDSRYTAIAYDDMARALMDYSREYGTCLEQEAYEYSDKAIKIYSYILGETSTLHARGLLTKALVCEYHKHVSEALAFVEKAIGIYCMHGDVERESLKTAEEIKQRLISALKM